MGLVHVPGGKEGLVGGDQGQIVRIGEIEERRLDRFFGVQSVALELHIQPSRKRPGQAPENGLRRRALAFGKERPHGPGRPAGKRDEAVGALLQGGQGNFRVVGAEIGLAEQFEQVAVTALVLDQQHQSVRCGPFPVAPAGPDFLARDAQLASDDGLHAGRRAGGRELERAEKVVGVGDGHRRHARVTAQGHQILDLDRTFGEGIGGMNAQVNEVGVGHGTKIPQPILKVIKMWE